MEKKVYEKKSEKIIDFITGFFSIPFILFSSVFLAWILGYSKFKWILNLIIFCLESWGIIYLSFKRRYLGMGLLFILVVVPLVFLGTCLLIGVSGNITRFFSG